MKNLEVYFRTRLVEAWDEHSVGTVAITDDHYVQWSAQPAGLQIECVSNRYLPESRQLTFQQRRRLQDAGWRSPVGDDLPNYWQRFGEREQIESAVRALVDAVDVLRLGLPSSERAAERDSEAGPLALLHTPAPEERPLAGRSTTVVVPVYKSGTRLVTWALQCLLRQATRPVTVVDLLSVSDDDLPPGPRVMGLDGAGVHPDADVVVARLRDAISSDLETWLRTSADLLSFIVAARARGRDVVVLAPWLIDRDPWLYAGIVRELTGELVMCVEDGGHGYAQEVALSVVTSAGCPAPIVLLGEHASNLDQLLSHARAALHVGLPEDVTAARAFQILVDPTAESEDDQVAEQVAQARNASLWSRFHLVMFHQLPRAELEDEALLLLEDLAVLVTTTDLGPVREDADRLLGGMVLRIGYWVDPTSETARSRLEAVAARLRQGDADGARLAESLQSFCTQPSEHRAPEPRDLSGRHSDDHSERVEAQMHYIPPGTTCSSKPAFAHVLEDWLAHEDREATIGPPSTFAGKALVWVELEGRRYHLNGDSQDKGVREYLDLVREQGADLPWHVIANTHGKVNKVAFGKPPTAVKYFYLYAKDEVDAPYTV